MTNYTNKPKPVIASGFSSQHLSKEIADYLETRVVKMTYKQFKDKEIQTTIEENVRGYEVVVVASAAGDSNKQEKEARLLMRAASRAGAKHVTLFLPYMWYGRSDDIWDERNSPALTDTIETLRAHCESVVIADPHNAGLTREKFLDTGSPVKDCTIAHFAFPYAVQLNSMIENGFVRKQGLLFAHADAGGVKRISRNFRACLYNILGLQQRNYNQDDWPQGLKDRDKATGKIRIKGVSEEVTGKDVAIFEDMISSGDTACESAALLKKLGARSVSLFATSGLFTIDDKKREPPSASVDKIDESELDAVFITDTYDHRLTDPALHQAIEESTTIHTIRTGPYLGAIIQALHMDVTSDTSVDKNSVSALMKGTHPDQHNNEEQIATPAALKKGNSLTKLTM